MGEPITLHRNGETLTVYGRQQMAVYVASGWQTDAGITLPFPPPPPPSAAADVPGVDATDSAVTLAAEHGIDLSGIVGSGKGGRITLADVKAAIGGN